MQTSHNELASLFRTANQKNREERNVNMITVFVDTVKNNPTKKKTAIIKEVANRFKLTYSATRIILIKGGVYSSKL